MSHRRGKRNGPPVFLPYKRDARLVRQWAIPGTPGLEHRIGGIEKEDVTGNVSYDPQNHEKMVHLRAEKVARIANDIPQVQVHGDADKTVPYGGGHPENIEVLPLAPGAVETTEDWAKKNRCAAKADPSMPQLDIVADLEAGFRAAKGV